MEIERALVSPLARTMSLSATPSKPRAANAVAAASIICWRATLRDQASGAPAWPGTRRVLKQTGPVGMAISPAAAGRIFICMA